MSWFYHWLGIDNPSGHLYLFYSGFGANFGEAAVIGALWHGLNCHEPGCLRPGYRITQEANGAHVRRCAHHHHLAHLPEGATP